MTEKEEAGREKKKAAGKLPGWFDIVKTNS